MSATSFNRPTYETRPSAYDTYVTSSENESELRTKTTGVAANSMENYKLWNARSKKFFKAAIVTGTIGAIVAKFSFGFSMIPAAVSLILAVACKAYACYLNWRYDVETTIDKLKDEQYKTDKNAQNRLQVHTDKQGYWMPV